MFSISKRVSYRNLRNYENLQLLMPPCVGRYEIPDIKPTYELDIERFVGFNFANNTPPDKKTALHFYVDDYQFERVWNKPKIYIEKLSKFGAVCSPDFSPYDDFPKVIQLYNHYRKHWLAAYWQHNGITVIPTITWSGPDTLDFAFEGEPEHSIVTVSSIGMFDTKEHTDWFMNGYNCMIDKLHPLQILWMGKVPDSLNGYIKNGFIVELDRFYNQMEMRKKWRKQHQA